MAINLQTWEDTTKNAFGTILQESLQKFGKESRFVPAEKFYSIQDVISIGDNFLQIIDKSNEENFRTNLA